MSLDVVPTLIGLLVVCVVAATVALVVWRAIKRR
jgi:hypothetical protein